MVAVFAMEKQGSRKLTLRWSRAEGKVLSNANLVTPNQRSLHTVTVVGKKIFVLGGWAANIKWSFLNIHWLDYAEQLWHTVPLIHGYTHLNVYYHTAVLACDQIYLFGGKEQRALRKSFSKFDTVTMELTRVCIPDIMPRFGHCAEYMELFDAIVLLFGQTTNGFVNRTIDSFNVKTGGWRTLKPKGTFPRLASLGITRSSCSHSRSIFCYTGHIGRRYGGQELTLLTFNSRLENCAWETPLIRGAVPALKGSSSLSFVNNYLVLFGGAVSQNALAADSDEVYVYDLAKRLCLDERDFEIEGTKARGRRNHENVFVNGKVLVFGGFGKRLNPYLELDVSLLLH